MPFFSVNFGLKTKMPSIAINKKILKLILIFFFLKKKKKTKGVVLAATTEVASATYGVARGHLSCFLGWLHGHPIFFSRVAALPPLNPGWLRVTPKVAGATFRGSSGATHGL
jgi:hypothetical protein